MREERAGRNRGRERRGRGGGSERQEREKGGRGGGRRGGEGELTYPICPKSSCLSLLPSILLWSRFNFAGGFSSV